MHVLIAGGGVAALEAALALNALGGDRVRVELLAPEPHFWYRPLAVAEPFGLGEVRRFELAELATAAGARFLPGRLVSVDAARQIAHTKPGGPLSYSALVIACGAVPKPAVEGAVTFRGPSDTEGIEQVLGELEAGEAHRVAFVVPAGAVWSLPAYELALMTAARLAARDIDADVAVVTPEPEPLYLFGREASAAVRRLLDEGGIALHTNAYPTEAREGELLLVGTILPADRVVALPRLQGLRIGGIPQTFEGFVPVDAHGRVVGVPGVYAAGDITTFAVKQGGIAAQQAVAAAEAIAAEAGASVDPRPFRPVLRGLLLTGDGPRYLRGDLETDAGRPSEASVEPLWWPPAKVVGRYLAPFLAEMSGTSTVHGHETGLPVEVELDPNMSGPRIDELVDAAVADALADHAVASVADAMTTDPLVVAAPEDTLGEVAERMSDLGVGSSLVVEYGRLIGILTSRDMLRALAARVHPSEARARQWMTADPITVTCRTPLAAAVLLMTEHGIHHLPVVEGERGVGIVALRDAVRLDRSPLKLGLGL